MVVSAEEFLWVVFMLLSFIRRSLNETKAIRRSHVHSTVVGVAAGAGGFIGLTRTK